MVNCKKKEILKFDKFFFDNDNFWVFTNKIGTLKF